MRTLGFLVFIAALVVGAIGVHERREAVDNLSGIEQMEQVTAKELASAEDGAKVLVQGTVATGTETEAPISKDQVAWWSHERILRQQVETQDCTGEECIDVTRQVLSELGVETSDRLDVNVGEVVLQLSVPNDPKAVTGLRRDATGGEDDPSGGDGRVEVRESVLVPGDTVTVSGRFTPTGDAASILKVDGVALVHVGSIDNALDRASAGRRDADKILAWAAALLLGGIALFVAGRRRAKARHAELLRKRAEAELVEAEPSATAAGEEQGARSGSTQDAN